MGRLPTSNDVARLAGVSQTTVSRVLNGRMDVAIPDHTRERVFKAAREIGYRLNHSARALVTGRSNLVALWMASLRAPLYAMVTDYMQDIAERNGFQLIITKMAGYSNFSMNSLPTSILSVEGIICFLLPREVELFLAANPINHVPIINMGSIYTEATDLVGVEIYSSTIEAMHHILSSECRRVAYVEDAYAAQTEHTTGKAYRDVVEQEHLKPEYIVTQDQSRGASMEATMKYVAEHGCPDGIMCLNDDLAIGTYCGLRKLGIRVPEDVVLVGSDGIEDTMYLDTPISTIVQPVEQMCDLAWQFFENRRKNPTIPMQRVMLSSYLDKRQSSTLSGTPHI